MTIDTSAAPGGSARVDAERPVDQAALGGDDVTADLAGFFAISETTAEGWTRLDDMHVFSTATRGRRPLVLSEPLLRVSALLGAFSGMYFTVVLTTDATYRTEFADDVGPEIRQALAVRSAYRVARGTHPQSRPETSSTPP